MRKKEERLVVTFHTTADAMAMERCCRQNAAPGRLIPVPRSLSAGCGLAWSAPRDSEEELRAVMERIGLREEAMHICLL